MIKVKIIKYLGYNTENASCEYMWENGIYEYIIIYVYNGIYEYVSILLHLYEYIHTYTVRIYRHTYNSEQYMSNNKNIT